MIEIMPKSPSSLDLLVRIVVMISHFAVESFVLYYKISENLENQLTSVRSDEDKAKEDKDVT